ncbi:MAG TPA: Na+ dependent nucleoside transporter N-terminal domain-containing protein, partial [Thermoanaerobaculia bacterium]|nr:Na+ dependent nucleoside transporter N-terminal domain-containing protein [Thermoanaerobaculia bacterium]
MIALLGMLVIFGIAWAISVDRRRIPWRIVLIGTALQLVFAVLILKTPWGRAFFTASSDVATAFLDFADAGSR